MNISSKMEYKHLALEESSVTVDANRCRTMSIRTEMERSTGALGHLVAIVFCR